MKTRILIILISILTNSLSYANDKSVKQADKLLDKVRKNLTSLSADFEQYEIDVNGNASEKQTGKVWLNSPDQFKWLYIDPIPQLIVASGKKIWIYDEDLEQVTIKKQQNKQNPIYVLLNKEETEKNYIISLEKKSKKSKDKTQWIKMLPIKESEEVKVVWLGIEDNNLTALKLQNQMDIIVVFEFKDTLRNPELSKDFFNFEIPKGTDVIENSPVIGEF